MNAGVQRWVQLGFQEASQARPISSHCGMCQHHPALSRIVACPRRAQSTNVLLSEGFLARVQCTAIPPPVTAYDILRFDNI